MRFMRGNVRDHIVSSNIWRLRMERAQDRCSVHIEPIER